MTLWLSAYYLSWACVLSFVRPDAQFFSDDQFVRELSTPIAFRQFLTPTAPTSHTAEPCLGGRLVLAYSGTCPHCATFAPIWRQVAVSLTCKRNAALQFGAFECSSASSGRTTNPLEWAGTFNASWPNNNATSIHPLDICMPIIGAYPTIFLAVNLRCQPKESFVPLTTEYHPYFGSEVSLYQLPIHRDDALGIIERIISQNLASPCFDVGNSRKRDTAIVQLLHSKSGAATSLPPPESRRWPQKALIQKPDWRLHDAIMGIYHILGSWIFSQSTSLAEMQVTTLVNFLLLLFVSIPDARSKASLLSLAQMTADKGVELRREEWERFINHELYVMGVPVPKAHENVAADALGCGTQSCSVWTLLHTIAGLNYATIQESHPSCLSMIDAGQYKLLPTILRNIKTQHSSQTSACMAGSDISETVHQLLYHFFNCKTCRKHFHEAYKSCIGGRCSWVSKRPSELQAMLDEQGEVNTRATEELGLVLWLWRFHNIVTVRTTAEKVTADLRRQYDESPTRKDLQILHWHEDVTIPPVSACASCRVKQPKKASAVSTEWLIDFIRGDNDNNVSGFDYNEQYNLSEVSRYLMDFYVHRRWLTSSNRWDPQSQTFLATTSKTSSSTRKAGPQFTRGRLPLSATRHREPRSGTRHARTGF